MEPSIIENNITMELENVTETLNSSDIEQLRGPQDPLQRYMD